MNIVSQLVNGKSIAVIEDSIVRGDTTKINVEKLRKAGATRVDVYVTFPQIRNPCFYGIDMSTYGELLGAKKTPEEVSKWIGADSVNYQNVEGLVRAIGLPQDAICTACITGKYPTPEAQRISDGIRVEYMNGVSDQGKRIYERRSKD
jgi:amidophosphoribosyltransferase